MIHFMNVFFLCRTVISISIIHNNGWSPTPWHCVVYASKHEKIKIEGNDNVA